MAKVRWSPASSRNSIIKTALEALPWASSATRAEQHISSDDEINICSYLDTMQLISLKEEVALTIEVKRRSPRRGRRPGAKRILDPYF